MEPGPFDPVPRDYIHADVLDQRGDHAVVRGHIDRGVPPATANLQRNLWPVRVDGVPGDHIHADLLEQHRADAAKDRDQLACLPRDLQWHLHPGDVHGVPGERFHTDLFEQQFFDAVGDGYQYQRVRDGVHESVDLILECLVAFEKRIVLRLHFYADALEKLYAWHVRDRDVHHELFGGYDARHAECDGNRPRLLLQCPHSMWNMAKLPSLQLRA